MAQVDAKRGGRVWDDVFVIEAIIYVKRQLQEITGVKLSLMDGPSSTSSLIVAQVVDFFKLGVEERDEVVSVCGVAVPEGLLKSEGISSVAELRVLLWVYHTIAKQQLATRSGGPLGVQSFELVLQRSQLTAVRAVGRLPAG
jgi:hypothetical protein